MELVMDVQEDQITFFENEKEKESEKEGKEKKKEEEKREKNEFKSKKFLDPDRLVQVVILEGTTRGTWFQSSWVSPFLEILSPPPELMLS